MLLPSWLLFGDVTVMTGSRLFGQWLAFARSAKRISAKDDLGLLSARLGAGPRVHKTLLRSLEGRRMSGARGNVAFVLLSFCFALFKLGPLPFTICWLSLASILVGVLTSIDW